MSRRGGAAGSSDDVGALEFAPDVEHRLALEVGLRVGGMRRAQDQHVAARDHFVERHELADRW